LGEPLGGAEGLLEAVRFKENFAENSDQERQRKTLFLQQK